jgi:hypothetical protein
MSFLNIINSTAKDVKEFMEIEWSVNLLIAVSLILFLKYRKTTILFLRAMLNPVKTYRYLIDKSVSFEGETFLLSLNNSFTTDEVKQLKRYEATTKLKIYRSEEETHFVKLFIETSLKDEKVHERDSNLMLMNDTPKSLTIRLSNETFDSLYKSFTEKDMRVFISFSAYKSLTQDLVDIYSFSSLDFQILETNDFALKYSVMMFKEFIEPELAKMKVKEEVSQ